MHVYMRLDAPELWGCWDTGLVWDHKIRQAAGWYYEDIILIFCNH
jgi:hypothetical protein